MDKAEQLIIRNIAILNVLTILIAVFVSFFIYVKTNYSLVFCLILLGISLGVIYILNKQLYTIVVIQTVLEKEGKGIGNKVDKYLNKMFEAQK